jgi:hypothetical protein
VRLIVNKRVEVELQLGAEFSFNTVLLEVTHRFHRMRQEPGVFVMMLARDNRVDRPAENACVCGLRT